MGIDSGTLVRLTLRCWGAEVKDKKVTQEITEKYNADGNAGVFRKYLIDPVNLKSVCKRRNAIRTFCYENTLPYDLEGVRFLPGKNFAAFKDGMESRVADFEEEVGRFFDIYPSLIEDRKGKLGGLFDESDFPSVADLKARFSVEIEYIPIPVGHSSSLLSLLDEKERERIQKEAEDRTKKVGDLAIKDLWDRLHGAVSHMADRLADPEAKFKESLVGNIAELVDLLPRMNVMNDPSLDKMAGLAKAKLLKYTAEELRSDEAARKEMADMATAVAGKIKREVAVPW